MASYFRLSALIAIVLLAGCTQLEPSFMTASEFERAVIFYERGQFAEALEKARSIQRGDADYRAARKLIVDINSITMQLSRRHMDMAEDYEKAGVYSRAVYEYKESLRYNPSNILAQKRIEVIEDALRSGTRPSRPGTKKASSSSRKGAKEEPEDIANTHYLKGKIYLESKAYARAIEEFTAVLRVLPAYMNTVDLLARARKERDQAVDERLKKGIAHFQNEEMELAIKEWEAVLELDPSNKVAADYKSRAEVIMERLRRIREKQSVSDTMMCVACSLPLAPPEGRYSDTLMRRTVIE